MQVICRDNIAVNRAADNGNAPLHVAASLGDEELVKLLLTARGINVNVSNSSADGATPLHVAVMHGKLSYCNFYYTIHCSQIMPYDVAFLSASL